MSVFTIDSDNHITVFASSKEIDGSAAGTETFRSAEELAALAAHWPAARLPEIWNRLPGVTRVERFTSRQVAVRRIWKALQPRTPARGAQTRPVASKQASAKNLARRPAQPATGENTKAAQIIALLRQPGGASLKSLVALTGWQSHSVRGFLSGNLGKKLGLRVKSFRRDGERVYKLRS